MRVISVRYPKAIRAAHFIYVGHAHPRGLTRHELANPFVKEPDGINKFRDWLATHPDRDRMLSQLWQDTEGGWHPLGCWCGDWEPGQQLECHAVVIAEAMIQRYGHLIPAAPAPR